MKRFLNKIIALIILAIVIASSFAIYNVAFATEENSKLENVKKANSNFDVIGAITWSNVKTFSHTNRQSKIDKETDISKSTWYDEIVYQLTERKGQQYQQTGEEVLTRYESVYCLLHGQEAKCNYQKGCSSFTYIKQYEGDLLSSNFTTTGATQINEAGRNVIVCASIFSDKYNYLLTSGSGIANDHYNAYWHETSQHAMWCITNPYTICDNTNSGYNQNGSDACSYCYSDSAFRKDVYTAMDNGRKDTNDVYKFATDFLTYKNDITTNNRTMEPKITIVSNTTGIDTGVSISDEYYKIGPFTANNYAIKYSANAYNLYLARLRQEDINKIADYLLVKVDSSSGWEDTVNKIMDTVEDYYDGDQTLQTLCASNGLTELYNSITAADKKAISSIKTNKGNNTTKATQYALLGGFTSGSITLDNNTSLDIGTTGSDCYIGYGYAGSTNNIPTNYKYPNPNSTFYIYVKISECGNATKLEKISLKYQKTDVEGEGMVASGTCKHCNKINQPILVVKSANLKIQEATIECTGVPLTTNITIKKYITHVNGTAVSESRANKTVDEKRAGLVEVQSGDEITFKIEVINTSSVAAKIQISDILPENGGVTYGSEFTVDENDAKKLSSGYLTVPAKSGTTNGTKALTVKVKASGGAGQYYNQASIQTGTAINTTTSGAIVNLTEENNGKLYDLDFYRIEETTVNINKYISKVEHTGGTVAYESDDRSLLSEADKKSTPMGVEYGDKITYSINIENVDGDIIKVDLKDTLPTKCKEVYVDGKKYQPQNGVLTISNVQVPAAGDISGTKTIEVTLIVDDSTANALEENKVEISKVKDSTGKELAYKSDKSTSSDFYKIKGYSSSIKKYLSSISSSETTDNNNNGLTKEANTIYRRDLRTEDEKMNNPVAVDNSDMLSYIISVTNRASITNTADSSSFKINQITEELGIGLEFQSASVTVYDDEGDGVSGVNLTVTDIGNNAYTFDVGEVEMKPGYNMVFFVKVKVTASNMTLGSIQNKAVLTSIKNVNNKEITKNAVSNEYVKMKDLIIAGKVWLDDDKNGLIDDKKETGLSNIVVKLYSVGTGTKGADTLVRTTKTDTNGLYTFAKKEDGSWYDGEYINAKNPDDGVLTHHDSEQRIPKGNGIQYYIEYEYDGLVYKSTPTYSGKTNLNSDGTLKNNNYKIDSNAAEFDAERKEFDKNYEIIANNKAYNGDLSKQKVLAYSRVAHKSYLSTDASRIMTSRSFINTSNQTTDYLWLFKQTTDVTKPETDYLKYINLGLVEKEELDISITQDVYEVKTTINGEQMTYEYNQNNYTLGNSHIDKEQEKDASGEETDLSKKYNSESYMTGYISDAHSYPQQYEFYAYDSDYYYKASQYNIAAIEEYKGKESELNIETTYRIRVTNHATDDNIQTYTGINEIVEYYDEEYVSFGLNEDGTVKTFNIKTKDENGYLENTELEVVKAEYVMEDGTRKEVILSTDSMYNAKRTLTGYQTLYIRPKDTNDRLTGDVVLAEGESLDILITFVVAKETIEQEEYLMLGDQMNIAEISAYSTYYKDNNGKYYPAGLVDKDSNPYNMTVSGFLVHYEDDTFKTGITQLTKTASEARAITGRVWDDARTEAITNEDGTQYIGDGKYDKKVKANEEAKTNASIGNKEEKDTPIKDMKVQLVERVAIPVKDASGNIIGEKVYEDTISANELESKMTVRTNSNGSYEFRGYIPGNYVVKFSYGDDASLANMVIFNGQDYKSTTYQATESVYAENKSNPDEVLATLKKANISDAKDDEIRRLETIAYSETMTNSLNNILRGEDSSDKEALVENTKMYSETAEFVINAEDVSYTDKVLSYKEAIEKFSLGTKRYPIGNIDFGIEYRPELQVALNKHIASVKVITSDQNSTSGMPLFNAVFEEYYGVVVSTDVATGATEFLTGKDGEVVKVARNATNEEVEKAAQAAGADVDKCETTKDGLYIITLAGTALDKENSVGLENLQYVSNTNDTQGFIYLNVDDEIIQGATVEIGYIFAASNLSEIDRVSSNLSGLRFKENTATQSYIVDGQYYDQIALQLGATTGYIDLDYSGARTARNKLFSEYYEYELNEDNTIKKDENGNDIVYRIRDKELSVDSNKAINSDDTYYGRYLGSLYYTGVLGVKDIVSELKVDKILDFVDNDMVFEDDKNKGVNGLWATTTAEELSTSGLINENVFVKAATSDGTVSGLQILDSKGISFNTTNRSNLAILLDDRVKDYAPGEEDVTINKDISKYILPRYSSGLNSFGTVNLVASKVISAEDITGDLNYENIGEIVQYSSVTGRVTNLATTLGNSIFANGEWEAARAESDTSATEQVTLTPPTGLNQTQQIVRNTFEGAIYVVIAIVAVTLVCVGVLVGIKLYRKRPIK